MSEANSDIRDVVAELAQQHPAAFLDFWAKTEEQQSELIARFGTASDRELWARLFQVGQDAATRFAALRAGLGAPRATVRKPLHEIAQTDLGTVFAASRASRYEPRRAHNRVTPLNDRLVRSGSVASNVSRVFRSAIAAVGKAAIILVGYRAALKRLKAGAKATCSMTQSVGQN